MADELSPKPEQQGPQGAGHYRADDDIELPPVRDTGSESAPDERWDSQPAATKKTNGVASIFGTAALIGAVLVGG